MHTSWEKLMLGEEVMVSDSAGRGARNLAATAAIEPPMHWTRRNARLGTLLGVTFGLAVAGLFSQTAQAATWIGAVDQNWNTGANWSGDTSAGQDFIVNMSTGNYPMLGTNSVFTPRDILVGSGASQTGRFDHNAGSLSLVNITNVGNWFWIGRDSGAGTYNLADTSGTGGTLTGFAQGSGSLNVGKLWIGGRFNTTGTGTVNVNTSGAINANSTENYSNHGGVSLIVGTGGGNGTLNIDNGTVNAAGIVDVASAFSNAQATQGTLYIGTGGILNSEGDFRTAYAGSAGAQANVNLTGGSLNVGSTTKRWLRLGHFDSGNSTINVNSGNLNLNTNTDIRFKTAGGAGTHVINLNSGAITSYSGNSIANQMGLGAGVVDLMNASSTANNTFNLNGGTLTIRQVLSTSSDGTRTFNFNGGTLRATGDTAAFFNLGTGNARANVRTGGAIIDTNSFNVTVAQALLHSNIGGDNAIDGGLTKLGAGTLTLTGVNTYTGNTTVSGGSLLLADNAALLFVIAASGVNNRITGGGTLSLNGDFSFDLSGAATAVGSTWNIVDHASLSSVGYSSSFSVLGFDDAGDGRWTQNIDADTWYEFDTGDGLLTIVPEPASLVLLWFGALCVAARRRR